jgi:hypothetical protein
VWIAESDDYSDERFLERLVGILDSEPNVMVAYCRSRIIKPDGSQEGFADWYLTDLGPQRWNADFLADGREECKGYFVANNSIPNASSAVFRRSIYERVGGTDENIRVCGDWKLWVSRAFEWKVAYLAEPLNYYREHDATVRSKGVKTGVIALEHVEMVRWMLERLRPARSTIERARAMAAFYWIPAVLSGRVPLRCKMKLLWNALSIDPHAMRRLIPPGWAAVRFKAALELRHLRQRFAGRAS